MTHTLIVAMYLILIIVLIIIHCIEAIYRKEVAKRLERVYEECAKHNDDAIKQALILYLEVKND